MSDSEDESSYSGSEPSEQASPRHSSNPKVDLLDLNSTAGTTLQSLPEGGFLGQVSFDSLNQTDERPVASPAIYGKNIEDNRASKDADVGADEILEVERALREAGFSSAPNSGLVSGRFLGGPADDDAEIARDGVEASVPSGSTKSFGLAPIKFASEEENVAKSNGGSNVLSRRRRDGSVDEKEKKELEKQIIILNSKLQDLTLEKGDKRVERLQRELEEQEKIMRGYQTENEKLYSQMKQISREAKVGEKARAEEILKLGTEIARLKESAASREAQLKNLRESLRQKEAEEKRGVKSKCVDCDLKDSELKEMSKMLDEKRQRIHELEGENFGARENLQRLNQLVERSKADAHLRESAFKQEMGEARANFEREIAALKSKLGNVTEDLNQQDRISATNKTAAVELNRLKDENESLKETLAVREKERKEIMSEKHNLNDKTIDLQRRLRQTENELRTERRNESSTFNRFGWAGESVVNRGKSKIPKSSDDRSADNILSTTTLNILENNIKRLQKQLETKDQEAEASMQALQEKFEGLKARYEEQIEKLKQKVSEKNSLIEKLKVCEECKNLKAEVEKVEGKLKSQGETVAKLRREQEIFRGANLSKEQRYQEQIVGLNSELQTRQKRLQILESRLAKLEGSPRRLRDRSPDVDGTPPRDEKPEAERLNKRIDDLVVELTNVNDERMRCKGQLELANVDLDDARKSRERALEEREAIRKNFEELRSEKEELARRFEALKDESERKSRASLETVNLEAVENLKAEFAKQVQKCMGLEQELMTAKFSEERLERANASVATLRQQVLSLEDRLADAKENQSPSAKRIAQLEERLGEISKRQRDKEDLMKKYATSIALSAVNRGFETHKVDEIFFENQRLKRDLLAKDEMVESFKREMDSIVQALRTMESKNF